MVSLHQDSGPQKCVALLLFCCRCRSFALRFWRRRTAGTVVKNTSESTRWNWKENTFAASKGNEAQHFYQAFLSGAASHFGQSTAIEESKRNLEALLIQMCMTLHFIKSYLWLAYVPITVTYALAAWQEDWSTAAATLPDLSSSKPLSELKPSYTNRFAVRLIECLNSTFTETPAEVFASKSQS